MSQHKVVLHRTILTLAMLLFAVLPGLAQRGAKKPTSFPGMPTTGSSRNSLPQNRFDPNLWNRTNPEDQSTKKSPLGMGTVYVPELNVPREARKEYEAGMHAAAKTDYDTAEEHFQKACELYPPYSTAFSALGIVYLRKNDTESARTALKHALELNPNNGVALRTLGFLLANEGKLADAERMLRTATTLYPADPECRIMRCYVEFKLHHYDAVIATANQFSKSERKRYPFARLLLALALEATGDYEKAAREYHEYLKKPIDPHGQAVAEQGLARIEKR